MSFYIYENWTRDRGRIHRAECSACNYGAGIHGEDSGRNGEWHGPYNDREQAFHVAAGLDRAEMSACARCAP